MEGSRSTRWKVSLLDVDVLPELHNYILAPQMAWEWRRWAWSLVLLTIGSTWREKAWVGWNWAHTVGILSSQGSATIEPSELWSFDVWSCSRCLWFYVSFIWKLGSVSHLTQILVLVHTPPTLILHVVFVDSCLCTCSRMPLPSREARNTLHD